MHQEERQMWPIWLIMWFCGVAAGIVAIASQVIPPALLIDPKDYIYLHPVFTSENEIPPNFEGRAPPAAAIRKMVDGPGSLRWKIWASAIPRWRFISWPGPERKKAVEELLKSHRAFPAKLTPRGMGDVV